MGWTWLKFKLIQAFIGVLIMSINEENPSKMNALEGLQHFFKNKFLEFFLTLKGSLPHSRRSDLEEFKTHPRFNGCPSYLQD